MRKALKFNLSRRSMLKTGAISLALVSLPMWQAEGIAQTINQSSSNAGSPKPNGLIAFNAGWMIPVEDQKALLALEDKKKEEVKALASQAPQPVVTSEDSPKPTKRNWSDKLQDAWKQVKSFF